MLVVTSTRLSTSKATRKPAFYELRHTPFFLARQLGSVHAHPPQMEEKHVQSKSNKAICADHSIRWFEVISRIYQNLHSIQFVMQIKCYTIIARTFFESLPETRCSVNAILKGECSYRSSHPPLWGMKCEKKGVEGGSSKRGYSHRP